MHKYEEAEINTVMYFFLNMDIIFCSFSGFVVL